jgi:hypothetical protein
MDEIAAMLADLPADQAVDSYRLGGEAFFLKFCKGVLDERDSGMVPGHYLPLGFWRRLETDPRIRGERGGVKVTPENLPRWFTATEFKEMVAKAWIGTPGIAAEATNAANTVRRATGLLYRVRPPPRPLPTDSATGLIRWGSVKRTVDCPLAVVGSSGSWRRLRSRRGLLVCGQVVGAAAATAGGLAAMASRNACSLV